MKLRLPLLLSFAAAHLLASEHSSAPANPAAHDSHAPAAPEASAPQHTSAPASADAPTTEPTATPALSEEILSLLRIGQTKLDQADYTSAEIAFRQVLKE